MDILVGWSCSAAGSRHVSTTLLAAAGGMVFRADAWKSWWLSCRVVG